MSDYRGPTAGLGDEPPDVVPRTGPPTGPVAHPQTEPVVAEAASELLVATPEVAAEAVEQPVAEVLGATVAEPAVDHEPAASEALAEVPRSEIVEEQPAPVRDVLVIDPAAAVPEQIAEHPISDAAAAEEAPSEVVLETEETSTVLSYEPEQLHAEEPPASPEADALPVEDLAADVPEHPTEPAAETVASPEAEPAIEAAWPPPVPPPLPVSEEPPTEAFAPEPEPPTEPVAEAPPPLPLPQTIPAPALAAPVIVRALRAPEPVPQAEPTLATVAATEILAPPTPPPPLAPTRSHSAWPRRLRRAALILVGLVVGYALLVLTLIVAYRWIDPPRSTLMIANHLTGEPVLYAPVPITSISPNLQRAVVTSEDARFCYHNGVDWAALYEAMNESRGGSTITMQTAKNLFLWPSRSYVRKAIEIPVAMTIDAFWPKRRILEVYLNIAEWGPGIFGAEAAAHYHFDKSASRLTAHEAALLAASLPNPIARDAGEPGRVTEILASRLRARLANSDAFVRCLGLRTPRPAPVPTPRTEPKAPQKAVPKAATTKTEPQIPPWRTTTDPAFNPWQN